MKLAIVYQAGLANVFEVTNFKKPFRMRRVLQGSFAECERFCQGAEYMGAEIKAFSRNVAGDVSLHAWKEGIEDCPFREKIFIRHAWTEFK